MTKSSIKIKKEKGIELSQFSKLFPILNIIGYLSRKLIVTDPTALRWMDKMNLKKSYVISDEKPNAERKKERVAYKSFNVISPASESGNSPVK